MPFYVSSFTPAEKTWMEEDLKINPRADGVADTISAEDLKEAKKILPEDKFSKSIAKLFGRMYEINVKYTVNLLEELEEKRDHSDKVAAEIIKYAEEGIRAAEAVKGECVVGRLGPIVETCGDVSRLRLLRVGFTETITQCGKGVIISANVGPERSRIEFAENVPADANESSLTFSQTPEKERNKIITEHLENISKVEIIGNSDNTVTINCYYKKGGKKDVIRISYVPEPAPELPPQRPEKPYKPSPRRPGGTKRPG